MNSPETLLSRSATAGASRRLASIDAARGLVILLMLLDHVRETFYLHHQVSDPLVISETPPDLFFSRLLAHLCAPVFVFLTGLSAWLYGHRQLDSRAAASRFLCKRGVFLVVLELTVVNFAWTFQFPPTTIYLQVIWAIGLCMLALAGLAWLPRWAVIAVAVALIAGHNLLDGLHLQPDHALHTLWAVLHDRGWIEVLDGGLRLRTSYPLLPSIGAIALGYAAGPWFTQDASASARQGMLLKAGCALLIGFAILRTLNGYGDKPWTAELSLLATAMSFLNVTKYPPSLLFIALTLGLGLLVLRTFERVDCAGLLTPLAVYGSAPMFFYIVHLYSLKLLYLAALAVWGANQGTVFGLSAVWMLWPTAVILALAHYPAVKAFSRFKSRRRDIPWLKYL